MKRVLAGIAVAVIALCAPTRALAQDVVGQAVTITLSNGSKLSGTVTARDGGKVTLKADLVGDVVIEEKDIAAFGPAAAATPTQAVPSQGTSPTVRWTTTGTLGYTFVSGAAPVLGVGDTHGVNLSMFTERAGPKDAVSLTGVYAYQRTHPAPAAAKNGSLTLAYNHTLTERLTVLTRSTYAQDAVQKINHRFMNLDGIGIMVASTAKVKFSIVPGVGFTTTRYDISDPTLGALFANVKNDAVGYGFFDYLQVNVLPALQLQQTFMHLHSFTTVSQHVSQSMVSLVGMVSPKVGLSIALVSNHDSQLPEPYIKRLTNTLTSGVQFKF
jgi:hypothetical protein